MYFEADGNSGNLYGTIWSGDAGYVVRDLKAFLKGKTEATIHLHTPGGSVFDGNLIYNALKNSEVKIHIVIDGLAASMGSILMMAGDTVSMAENAFVMIHSPSGYVEGNADEMTRAATLLQSMEKMFVKMYVRKTGKTEAVVKEWLKGDNWFDAETAKSNGLIDNMIESVMEDIDMNAMKDLSLVALASSFDDQYIPRIQADGGRSPKKQTNQKSNMKLNAKAIAALGIPDNATEEQINAAVERLAGENQRLKQEAKTQHEAKVKALVDPAVKEGKITAAEKQEWENLANTNFDLAKSMLEKVEGKSQIPVGDKRPDTGQTDEREDWTFTDWSRKDTKGLLAMKSENPEKYRALAEASGVKL